MLDILVERLRQKKRTVGYPDVLPKLPPRFRGRPFIDAARCKGAKGAHCAACAAVCPTGALTLDNGGPALDMGLCTFCGACARACTEEALVFTTDWRLASTERQALIVRPGEYVAAESDLVTQSFPERPERRFALPALPVAPTRLAGGAFARSFRLRQVTAAGCGACEADLNVLATVVFDIGRFGMDFVASPRHADGLVLTGPLPDNMRDAFFKCLTAMPEPRIVIAVGACAISGGLFRSLDKVSSCTTAGHPDVRPRNNPQNAEGILPYMEPGLYIPGCPPHPYTSLDGFLRLLGQH